MNTLQTKDINFERQKARYDTTELIYYFHKSRENFELKHKMIDTISKTNWGRKDDRYFLPREEIYKRGLEAGISITGIVKNMNLSQEKMWFLKLLVDLPGGLDLHYMMFIPTIETHGTEEQKKYLLPLCHNLKIIGTYAQTELGHGTYLRGLETTVTYDIANKNFKVNSNGISGSKWWPGGLGKTATHVVLTARLIIDYKDYGPHHFIVQVRDLETHKALPGIDVGDIGPKFGINGIDNGYLNFANVIIPKNSMLSRYASIDDNGNYTPPPKSNSKAMYSTMIYVRTMLIDWSGRTLSKAATIATRYASVRRQTPLKDGEPEIQVLDYQNVYGKLIPQVCTSYVLLVNGNIVQDMYNAFEKARKLDDFMMLPELHAITSGLKALTTELASQGIEVCRFCCGGHGYCRTSGLPDIYENYVQNPTWEGENDVLYLQTGRFLLKAFLSGRYTEYTKFLEKRHHNPKLHNNETIIQDNTILDACHIITTHLIKNAIEELKENGKGAPIEFEGMAWNNSTMSIIKASKSFCYSVLVYNFLKEKQYIIQYKKVSPNTLNILDKCLKCFTLNYLDKNTGELLESEFMNKYNIKSMRKQYNELLLELRHQGVSLVDSFGLSDYELNSALGVYDGNAYEELLRKAKESPFNKTEEGPGWDLLQILTGQIRSKM